MGIITTIGCRHYEFDSQTDLSAAYSIWATPCDQDEFEKILKEKGIIFECDISAFPEEELRLRAI